MKKRIVLPGEKDDEIRCEHVGCDAFILATKDNKPAGMVLNEKEGWILRISAESGSTGHHKSLLELMRSCQKYGYEFYLHDKQS